MTPAIIHLGARKAGSSALQTALCLQPSLAAAAGGARFEYAALQRDGAVIGGEALRRQASLSAHGYVSAAPPRILATLPAERLREAGSRLREVAPARGGVILSSESWFTTGAEFAEHNLLGALGLDVQMAVVYLRPPASYLNAAWWQWGAWNDKPFDKWLANHIRNMDWAGSARQWTAVPGVRAVKVRILPADIVADFCGLLGVHGVAVAADAPVHRALPATILRVFQRHRELKPGPHGIGIDLILERRLGSFDERPPWVLDRGMVERIVSATRQSNLEIREMLDAESRRAMDADERWWDAAAYAGLPVESPAPCAPDPQRLDALFARALQAIETLERENRELRASRAAAHRTGPSVQPGEGAPRDPAALESLVARALTTIRSLETEQRRLKMQGREPAARAAS